MINLVRYLGKNGFLSGKSSLRIDFMALLIKRNTRVFVGHKDCEESCCPQELVD